MIAGAVASVPREPRCPPPGGRPDATGAISFDSTEVDQDAVVLSQEPLVSGALPPARAVAQFVIDSTGRADPGTLSIVPGGDSILAAAVREFIPRARFRPAELAGCRVRVWARWPFRVLGPNPDRSVPA